MSRGNNPRFAGGLRRPTRAASEYSQAKVDAAEPEVQRVTKELVSKMTQLEPDITANMKNIEQLTGGELVGLDFRLKTEKSLARKIRDTLKDEGFSRAASEVASEIADAVRYTLRFNNENYVDNVEKTLNVLRSQGYDIKSVKNFWTKGDPYQGINIKLERNGILTELQLHTTESHKIKEERNHKDYEIYRSKEPNVTQEEKKAAYQRMVANADSLIPDPVDFARLMTIGTIALQPFA